MFSVLVSTLGLAAALQKDLFRFVVCGVYVSAVIGHQLKFGDSYAELYYSSAALFDLTVILIYTALRPERITARLSLISVISICLNFYGWVIWEVGIDPTTYNLGFALLYLWAAAEMIRARFDNDTRRPKRVFRFSRLRRSSVSHVFKDKGEI